MSRPMLLVFLLMILIITSQFEWRQPLVSDITATPAASYKQLQISNREEIVKEKILISQEKIIHRLNEVVRNLQQKLALCGCMNESKRLNDAAL